MKFKNRSILLFTLFLFLFAFLSSYFAIPKEICVIKGKNYSFNIKSPLAVKVSSKKAVSTSGSYNLENPLSLTAKQNGEYQLEFNLLGVLPVKSNLRVIEESYLYPSGQSCGVKILTDGVLVISIEEVNDDTGKLISPAEISGIIPGDFLKKANGEPVKNTKHLSQIVKKHGNKPISIELERNGEIKSTTIIPVKTASGNYVLGMWVRDSTAGLGTLTFYNGDKSKFAALGHSITDIDTGEIMQVKDGDLVKSTIIDYKKGKKGDAGELIGIFDEPHLKIGTINKNNRFGLYGDVKNKEVVPDIKPVPIGLKSDIKLGEAKIISTIENSEPEEFEVEIVKINNQSQPDVKGLVIKVTDEKLIKKTGGIVQGMSGSPILQNGKLVGAVTHVFVNDPTRGYGIFIENMLAEAEKIK